MLEKVVKNKRVALRQRAEKNTKRTTNEKIVAARDDVWRGKIRVYVREADLKRFIENGTMVYAQLPSVKDDYFACDEEKTHCIALDVEEHKMIPGPNRNELFVPVYRQRDLKKLINLLRQKEGKVNAK